eukprot:CAMPEP_0177766546 /NCGR_PEP_ID=MMETSP0491_2-20121128/8578_1 /TAXON_ID=63592 /ORGANISM="Tetraselmis chuii, Strain PLY429" /LENGTH=259 /DNA_ID=CAMNT_0019282959 /DNA_START=104 /DNA_END=880 /DNA_ORIENTATION=-
MLINPTKKYCKTRKPGLSGLVATGALLLLTASAILAILVLNLQSGNSSEDRVMKSSHESNAEAEEFPKRGAKNPDRQQVRQLQPFPPALYASSKRAAISLALLSCEGRQQIVQAPGGMARPTPTMLRGASLPFLYGTAWKKERTTELVMTAVLAGFRGVDTACQPKHYREDLVGTAIRRLREEHSIAREALWLQTKYTPATGQDPANIPYDPDAPFHEQVSQSLARSLDNLNTSYIDSLVLHSPLRSRADTLAVWRQFE